MTNEKMNKIIAQVKGFYNKKFNDDAAVALKIKYFLEDNELQEQFLTIDGNEIYATVKPFIMVTRKENKIDNKIFTNYETYSLVLTEDDFFWIKDICDSVITNTEGSTSSEKVTLVSREKVDINDLPTEGYEIC